MLGKTFEKMLADGDIEFSHSEVSEVNTGDPNCPEVVIDLYHRYKPVYNVTVVIDISEGEDVTTKQRTTDHS